jgi:DNA-binding transcriptional MocR family regulator
MLWTIDRQSRTPLHEQIAGSVRRNIADGALVLGEQLPPATELAESLAATATPCSRRTTVYATKEFWSSAADAEHASPKHRRPQESTPPLTSW